MQSKASLVEVSGFCDVEKIARVRKNTSSPFARCSSRFVIRKGRGSVGQFWPSSVKLIRLRGRPNVLDRALKTNSMYLSGDVNPSPLPRSSRFGMSSNTNGPLSDGQ